MTIVKLSAKGQLVIPSEIRERYDLRRGDRFLVREEAGAIVLQPLGRHPVLDLRGVLKGGPSLTQALLEERRADRAREDHGKDSGGRHAP
jgi:AbrB family looped-hinge helix DNA binding protein